VLAVENLKHGVRVRAIRATAEAVGCCPRTLYAWRERYLRKGFAGLLRVPRSDRGRFKTIGERGIAAIADAVPDIRAWGDVASAWRLSGLRCSYGSYRFWVRTIQHRLKVIEMPVREEDDFAVLL